MIVSWNWLKEYVQLDMPVETLTERLMMAGLNLEGVSDVEGDLAVDLEVTSNRPDCLSHLGVAREVGVLFDRECKLPPAQPAEKGPATSSITSVEIRCPDLCPQYIARVVRGVKIAPSPSWMQRRLKTLGIRPINNVVDITNYVLMECSQPLHAFDFDKLKGHRIIVRRPTPGEKLTAIDQREYPLQPDMCVIADAERPVAIAGVMGGFDSEISDRTTNVLIEIAEFAPMSVRSTARKLNLHSDSSYRFERGVDRYNLDWVGRRCAQLVLELAGGELCSGSVFAGTAPAPVTTPIVLRFSQIKRIVGIDIPRDEVIRILVALGLKQAGSTVKEESARFIPPSWRRDLTREIDLIEEAARVHGYEQIPEDVLVPLEVSTRPLRDRVIDRIAGALNADGFCEAVTLSFVSEDLLGVFRPWDANSAGSSLKVEHSSRQRENILRRSLIPSLLQSRRQNERHGNFNAQLYEVARVYLAAEPGKVEAEPTLLGAVSGKSFAEMKGLAEALVDAVNHRNVLMAQPSSLTEFTLGRGAELTLNGKPWGWLGELSDDVRAKLDLQDPVTVLEVDLSVLEASADLSPVSTPLPQYPAIERDLNFVLDEAVTWQELAEVVRNVAGSLLETVSFEGQYRGPGIPADKKSYVLRAQYRAADRTLTSEEVDAAQQAVITACRDKLAATLR